MSEGDSSANASDSSDAEKNNKTNNKTNNTHNAKQTPAKLHNRTQFTYSACDFQARWRVNSSAPSPDSRSRTAPAISRTTHHPTPLTPTLHRNPPHHLSRRDQRVRVVPHQRHHAVTITHHLTTTPHAPHHHSHVIATIALHLVLLLHHHHLLRRRRQHHAEPHAGVVTAERPLHTTPALFLSTPHHTHRH